MKNLGETFAEIRKEHRKLFVAGVILTALSVILLGFSLFSMKFSSATVRVGYADIGSYQGGEVDEIRSNSGYVSGKWMEMLAFPLLAVVLGVMHNLIAVKLYQRRGEAMSLAFVIMSIAVVAGAILVLMRLLGEG